MIPHLTLLSKERKVRKARTKGKRKGLILTLQRSLTLEKMKRERATMTTRGDSLLKTSRTKRREYISLHF